MRLADHPAVKEPPVYSTIMQVLQEQCEKSEAEGIVLMRPEIFFPEAFMPELVKAYQWWPRKQIPDRYTWTFNMLGVFSSHRFEHNTRTLPDIVTAHANNAVTYLKLEGRNPQYPNEDKAERMRRLNRERQARHRKERKEHGPEHRTASSIAWDKVQEAYARKRQVEAEHDAIVKAAYQAMNKASEQRAFALAEQDILIEAALQAHKATKQNPPE